MESGKLKMENEELSGFAESPVYRLRMSLRRSSGLPAES
jgi:hypothetical protein